MRTLVLVLVRWGYQVRWLFLEMSVHALVWLALEVLL